MHKWPTVDERREFAWVALPPPWRMQEADQIFQEENNARVNKPSRAKNSSELRPKAGDQSKEWLKRHCTPIGAWRPVELEDEPGSTVAAPELERWAPASVFRGLSTDNEIDAAESERVARISRSEHRWGQPLDISFVLQPAPIVSLQTSAGPLNRAAAEVSTVLPLPILALKHKTQYVAPIREQIHMLVELLAHLQDASRVPEIRDIPTDFSEVLLSRLLGMLPCGGGDLLLRPALYWAQTASLGASVLPMPRLPTGYPAIVVSDSTVWFMEKPFKGEGGKQVANSRQVFNDLVTQGVVSETTVLSAGGAKVGKLSSFCAQAAEKARVQCGSDRDRWPVLIVFWMLNDLVSQVSSGSRQRYQVLEQVPTSCVNGCADLAREMRAFPRRLLVLGADIQQWRGIESNPSIDEIWRQHQSDLGKYLVQMGVPVIYGRQFWADILGAGGLAFDGIHISKVPENKTAMARFTERATNFAACFFQFVSCPDSTPAFEGRLPAADGTVLPLLPHWYELFRSTGLRTDADRERTEDPTPPVCCAAQGRTIRAPPVKQRWWEDEILLPEDARAALSFAPFKREIRDALLTAISDGVDTELELLHEAFGSTEGDVDKLRPEFGIEHGSTDAEFFRKRCPMLLRYAPERLPPFVRGDQPYETRLTDEGEHERPCGKEINPCVERLRWLVHMSEGQRQALPEGMRALAIAPAGLGRDFIPGGGSRDAIAFGKDGQEARDRARPMCATLNACEPYVFDCPRSKRKWSSNHQQRRQEGFGVSEAWPLAVTSGELDKAGEPVQYFKRFVRGEGMASGQRGPTAHGDFRIRLPDLPEGSEVNYTSATDHPGIDVNRPTKRARTFAAACKKWLHGPDVTYVPEPPEAPVMEPRFNTEFFFPRPCPGSTEGAEGEVYPTLEENPALPFEQTEFYMGSDSVSRCRQ